MTGELDRLYSPDGYVDEDWRIMSTLRAPAVATGIIQKDYINKENKYWQEIKTDDLLTIADREGIGTGIVPGSSDITANDRNTYLSLIQKQLAKVEDPLLRVEAMIELEKIENNIRTIQSSHMDDARKTIELTAANHELKKLVKSLAFPSILKEFEDSVMFTPEYGFGVSKKPASTEEEIKEVISDGGMVTEGLKIIGGLIDFGKL